MPIPSKDYGPPPPMHHRSDWYPRAEKLIRGILEWSDVRQLGVFGRNGYFVRSVLFATVPVHENALEIWLRLSEAGAGELAKNPRASVHTHPVKGWMRLRLDDDAQVDEALTWVKRAYDNAITISAAGHGVPVEKVPELSGHPAHRIPQGPRSGQYTSGMSVKGALPQGPMKSNLEERDLP